MYKHITVILQYISENYPVEVGKHVNVSEYTTVLSQKKYFIAFQRTGLAFSGYKRIQINVMAQPDEYFE